MKIFNQSKTQELDASEFDLKRGYLKQDKIFIAHHDAVTAVEEQGHYKIVREYPNGGKDVEWVVDVPKVEAHEAFDEYEDIQVFIPYTVEELKGILRETRKPLLEAFDKWEKAVLRGRETDDASVMAWYSKLLDLDENAFTNVPQRIRYYL